MCRGSLVELQLLLLAVVVVVGGGAGGWFDSKGKGRTLLTPLGLARICPVTGLLPGPAPTITGLLRVVLGADLVAGRAPPPYIPLLWYIG